jgi:hypothetical protein
MIDKSKTCRCCFQVSAEDTDLYEFSSEVAIDADSSDFVKIGSCYYEITSIILPAEEEDQNKICSGCLADLKFSFIFKKKCIDTAKAYEQQQEGENFFCWICFHLLSINLS